MISNRRTLFYSNLFKTFKKVMRALSRSFNLWGRGKKAYSANKDKYQQEMIYCSKICIKDPPVVRKPVYIQV